MWQKEDWHAEFKDNWCTTNVNMTLLMEQNSVHFINWLAILYKKYLFGDWNGSIPDVKDLQDKQHLASEVEEYCIIHFEHEKFGTNIVETGSTGTLNAFSFFDYHSLEPLFKALDKYPNVQLPHIPTYHAVPSDRLDYNWFLERGLIAD